MEILTIVWRGRFCKTFDLISWRRTLMSLVKR
jgi:hypothetical protein